VAKINKVQAITLHIQHEGILLARKLTKFSSFEERKTLPSTKVVQLG
jgi:hypothetical protein